MGEDKTVSMINTSRRLSGLAVLLLSLLLHTRNYTVHSSLFLESGRSTNADTNTDTDDLCSNGRWEQSDAISIANDPTQNFVHMYSASYQELADDNARLAKWRAESCPFEDTVFSCNFNDRDGRADMVKNRRWIPENPQCKPFSPPAFLEVIRNRQVVLFGDSTMRQTWKTIACSLYNVHLPEQEGKGSIPRFYARWREVGGYASNHLVCPLYPKQCVIDVGIGLFDGYNSVFRLMEMHEGFYKSGMLQTLVKEMYLTSDDVIVINFGLHYNSDDLIGNPAMHKDLEHFRHDVIDLGSRCPHIFFQESFPQHFTRAEGNNGYYTSKKGFHQSRCSAIENITFAQQYDWRNTMLDKVLRRMAPTDLVESNSMNSSVEQERNVNIVRLAKGLITQWDAHLDHDNPYNRFSTTGDCTHYCSTSGALRFVVQQLYNSLHHHLHKYSVSRRSNDSIDGNDGYFLPDWPILKDGTLIRYHLDREVYYIEHGTKRLVYNANVFFQHGWDFGDVKVVKDPMILDILPTGPTLT